MKETKAKILVVEDEKNMREVLSILLEGEGYEVVTAADGDEGLQWIRKDIFDLIITDIKMPGAGGFDILECAREASPETLVIMITAFGTMESAIDAMKHGAYDYIHKPFKIDEIRLIVRNAVDKHRLKQEVSLLRETVRTSSEMDNIIGKSRPMQEVLALIPKVAGSNSNVLITGESGTGKELVASALHNMSPRGERTFVAINCASLPEGLLESELFGHMRGSFTGAVQNKQGLFETANGGTLFMDEVAEMPMNLQAKFLRAIENGTFRRVGGNTDIRVDTRIIAATNKNLDEAIRTGTFREDLYFRLNVIPLHIAPLRERQEDIPPLVEHFIGKYSDGKRQFSGSAMKLLMEHPWKGNVRELENMVERILLFTDTEIITDADLPPELKAKPRSEEALLPDISSNGGVDLEEMLAEFEKKYLVEALRSTGGKQTEAAELLRLSYRSFRHKLSKYGIR
ncbi:MAG: sigma-54 dependent transcriptional regulator [Nitrospirota bacterium]|jgi:two-component system response regulator PilR (NtrC family)